MTSELTAGLSVVVPVYNSEGSLSDLTTRLEPVLAERGVPFEVIFVNDGSRDGSWNVVTELAGRHPFVRGFTLMRNYGQHNALLCGIRAARYATIWAGCPRSASRCVRCSTSSPPSPRPSAGAG